MRITQSIMYRNTRINPICNVWLGLIVLTSCAAIAAPLGSAFTYEGRLSEAGHPANGSFDFTFALFPTQAGGPQAGPTVTNLSLSVANGSFQTSVDFGQSVFNGAAYWLEIGVRTNGSSGAFTMLAPRQSLTPTPYALFAVDAGSASNAAVASIASAVASNSITAESIQDGSIGAAKFSPGAAVRSINGLSQEVIISAGPGVKLVTNANDLQISGTAPAGWSRSGDNIASGEFLGTLNNLPLELRVNGSRALRIEPGSSPNVLGGFSGNAVTSGTRGAVIAGGGDSTATNLVTDSYGTISGGRGHRAGNNNASVSDAIYATVGGGIQNTASGNSATVAGGWQNEASASQSVIGGGNHNISSGYAATVAGGYSNQVSGFAAAIGGGHMNIASGNHANIAGGDRNLASTNATTVSGGVGNKATGAISTIGGGFFNTASGQDAVVAGGSANIASGRTSTVGGGFNNRSEGWGSTVPGGNDNLAQADYSFAAGRNARAVKPGQFVWADSLDFPFGDFQLTRTNSFYARAVGGFYFYTATDTNGIPMVGAYLLPGSGSWGSTSDKNVKTNFQPVDAGDILQRVARLPLNTWSYKSQSSSIRHIGPTAQDFHSFFGVGEDDRHISTVDADGVALAAIQALYKQLQDDRSKFREELAVKRGEIEQLKSMILNLTQRVDAMSKQASPK